MNYTVKLDAYRPDGTTFGLGIPAASITEVMDSTLPPATPATKVVTTDRPGGYLVKNSVQEVIDSMNRVNEIKRLEDGILDGECHIKFRQDNVDALRAALKNILKS